MMDSPELPFEPRAAELPVHPLTAAFPMMSAGELAELAEDIKQNGQRFPIMLDHAGELLVDGRNRRAACKLAGLPPIFARLAEDQDPIAYIVSLNLARRHLTKDQAAKAMAVANPEPRRAGRQKNGSVTDQLKPSTFPWPGRAPWALGRGKGSDVNGIGSSLSLACDRRTRFLTVDGARSLPDLLPDDELALIHPLGPSARERA
jgi:hypothetical protein